jgi:hypothetical protein
MSSSRLPSGWYAHTATKPATTSPAVAAITVPCSNTSDAAATKITSAIRSVSRSAITTGAVRVGAMPRDS